MTTPAIGLMFHRDFAPETLPDISRMVEATGLDELWVVEDAFFNGGISAAAVALAVTERIAVGIGILPAVVRNGDSRHLRVEASTATGAACRPRLTAPANPQIM